jgi:teichoic acid transport system ATP-binding protein
VAGLIPPTRGRVFHSGQAALLGVNAALMRGLSGERNIMIGGLALGLSSKEIRERMPEIVDFAGLGDFVYLPMSAYSSGMAARLRFAISTMARPDVLMIDEALATGDAAFRQKSKQRIDDIREHAGTVFFVSHSLASVGAMCTRIIWLDKGQIRMDGPVDEVSEAYRAHLRSASASGPAGAVLGQSKKPAPKKPAPKRGAKPAAVPSKGTAT